ncbi:MAG: ATP-binding protein [Candidatus Saccharimonas sp.]
MKAGGTKINQKAAKAIQLCGIVLPIILFFYGILVQAALVDNTHFLNDTSFYVISFTWLAFSLYQFLIPSTSKQSSAVRLILYHMLAASYVLFVSGFVMPFIGVWAILCLASYVYFSENGLFLSILTLIGTAVLDTTMFSDKSEYTLHTLLSLIATIAVGIIVTTIARAHNTDRLELTRSREQVVLQHDRMLTIVNNLAAAVLATDSDGNIQVYNAASLDLLDTNASPEGRQIDSIIKLIDENNRPVELTKLLRAARSVEIREDLSMMMADETVRLSLTYSPIRGTAGSPQATDGYVLILRDITKQKSLEEERDEFISVVSHELRTPITVVEGTLSNVQLMMGRNDIPKATLTSNIDVAHEQIVFLARMVNDLSTLSRAERGVADAPETIDVKTLIDDLYHEYQPEAAKKRLSFDIDASADLGMVNASSLYLRELLQNFITNAIKYTKKGGVTIIVRNKEDTILFAVKDTGIGISKSDQTHIYNKFWRSEDYRTRETGGTGLGLYVATKLAKKLGTIIEMKSRLNHGSTFSFSLPAISKDK